MKQAEIIEIMKYLPHRYPFLLVDRVLELEVDNRIRALKNVTINEPFFQGHFPGFPVMPGVLVVEAMAQAGGVLTFETMGKADRGNSIFLFAGIDAARFKRVVKPGDQLILDVSIARKARGLWKFKGVATVDGDLVAEAMLMCAMRDINPEGNT